MGGSASKLYVLTLNRYNAAMQNQDTDSLLNQAKTYNRQGNTAAAVEAYQAAAGLFAAQGDFRGLTRCWSGIGKAYGKSKEYDQAVTAFGQAAHYAGQAGWRDKQVEALYNQGLTMQAVGLKGANLAQVEGAIAAFEQALAVARVIEDRESVGVLLVSLGFACAWARLEDKAIIYFSEAAPFALDNTDFDTTFSALSSLGVLLSNRNRAVEAIPHFERALELAKTSQGDLVAVADTFANLGVAYEKAGRLVDAIEAVDTYREILHTVGDVKSMNAQAMLKRLKTRARIEGLPGY